VRALAAAQAKLTAGSPEAARRLAAIAEAGPLDPLDRARVELLRAKTATYPTYSSDGPRLLVHAARTLAPLDASLSRETYLEAISAALFADRLGEEGALRRAAEAALAAPQASQPPRAVDVLLDGLATRLVEGAAAGFPTLKQALAAFRTQTDSGWGSTIAMRIAMELLDDDSWRVLANRKVQVARETGALSVLPLALMQLAILHIFNGHFVAAAAAIQEEKAIGAAIGAAHMPYAPVHLAGWRGRLQETTALIATTVRVVTARGEGLIISTAAYASATTTRRWRRR
jgi:hypothetical protein